MKDNLGNAALGTLVATTHGEVSGKIKQLDNNYLAHKIARAVAGCAAGADGVIGAADYSVDTLNAAFYCLGFTPGYCSMAHKTLAPKNNAIVDTALAAIDPQTYKKMVHTVGAAYDGDSAAREAVGAFLISSIKKKPNARILDGYLKNNPLGNIADSKAARQSSNFKQHTVIESKIGAANLFNNQNAGIRLGNMELKQMPNSANKVNTAKVFDSSKIGNAQLQKEVFAYAEKLGGGKLTSVSNSQGRWYIKTVDGATINVRSVSSTPLPDGTKPRWTIEIINDKRLNSMISDKASIRNRPRELKFK